MKTAVFPGVVDLNRSLISNVSFIFHILIDIIIVLWNFIPKKGDNSIIHNMYLIA